ncbi:HlyD family secretion protein [Sandaracinobacteroides saxicola]|uniref:HlyD family secretion protein n=1 Tax=Sandaracinobacteroides saxicola TaxID=2759707 RepID=A0A7G5IE11_9SPHN|nr:HlyD family secretion protein [Sandaracinobacteroides saxicola]QMW21603.1 HlyD family secretion protein [Sandaracinobacteroides saxicola]
MSDTPAPETAPATSTDAPRVPTSKRAIPLIILAGVALGGGGWWYSGRDLVSTDDAFVEAHVSEIRAEVAGRITAMRVRDNQVVAMGTPMFDIDPATYQIRVDRAEATLGQTQAQIGTAQLTVDQTRVQSPAAFESAQAQVSSAVATLARARADLARLRAIDPKVTTQQAIDLALSNERSAAAALADARARAASAGTVGTQIAVASNRVGELRATMAVQRADLASAQVDLQRTRVVAPVSGRVARRSAEVGSYAQPGQLLALVVQNDPWIVANLKETQLARVRIGDRVDITVDAYGGLKLRGVVDSIQAGSGSRFSAFPAENATGNFVKVVQRVPVKIRITSGLNPKLPLGPGMSVVSTIRVSN